MLAVQYEKGHSRVKQKFEIRPTNCPLCDSQIVKLIVKRDQFAVGECTSCRLAVTMPASFVSEPSYEAAPQYAAAYGQDEKFRIYARNLLAHVSRYVSGGRLLDVGCSVGLLVDEAGRAGYSAEGIDLDTNAVEFAKKSGRAVSRAALEDWGGGYDVICLAHTLEHIPQPIEFLAACVSRLNPNGSIVVQVPCYRGLHPRLFQLRWYGWVLRQHYFHYSAIALRRLFEKCGLQTIDLWQESMDHRPPVGMRRREKPLALLSHWVAQIGAALGCGDQLVGIAKIRGNN